MGLALGTGAKLTVAFMLVVELVDVDKACHLYMSSPLMDQYASAISLPCWVTNSSHVTLWYSEHVAANVELPSPPQKFKSMTKRNLGKWSGVHFSGFRLKCE
mmetsp:Transcript_131020/g.280222  ORF Transcript_131020/g.280222 Transcript_131020/m.280222 type:complete len:102 (+) Transcript_131020:613-918(+)